MKKFLFIPLLLILCSNLSSSGQEVDIESVKKALRYQMENYPYSQYRDVYKNFMQDFFGPGHMITDTASSSKYLRRELSETVQFEGPDYEPTGFKGNFYRVNIKKIADGTIPYNTFFDVFVESVQGIQPPDPQNWKETWYEIDDVIKSEGISFINEEDDRKALKDQFEKNDFVVHHSPAYDKASNFHYRIISKEKFEEVILPFLNIE